MRLSHGSVIVIALIISGIIQVSADAASRSPPTTDVIYDAVKSSSTDTLNSPSPAPSDSLTIQKDPLKSTAERDDGCSACQLQQQQQPVTPGDVTLTCHIISGIFSKDRLAIGSHVITAIPQHACRINITGTAIAHGHLVLTTSSGDRILTGRQPMSTHRRATAVGTDFTFYAMEKKESPSTNNDDYMEETATQYIVADGPLDQGINVRVVKELDRGATEILYTYTIPKRNQSTVTYHRARHHRNPRSTSMLKRHDPPQIHSSREDNPGEASTAWKEVDTPAEKEEIISATKPQDDTQLQNDQPYLQPGSKDLGHDGVLGHRKWSHNWNSYPAGRPEQFPNGLIHHQRFPDSRRHLPEVHGSPAVQPFYAALHSAPLSRHQSPPSQNGFVQSYAAFSQPEMGLQTPEEAGFHKPEVSLSHEDVGLDKPETQFSQQEVDTTESGASDDDQNDYDLQTETRNRDHEGGGGPQRPEFDPRTQQQQHPTNYLQGQGHGYAFYQVAGKRSDLLEIPIYQRGAAQSSSDPAGTVYHAQFYRNSFSPDVAGHSLRVYGPQPRWPHDSQFLPEGSYPPLHRSADGSNAAESRHVHHPQIPAPPPPGPGPALPLTAAQFNRPDLASNHRHLDAADDVDSYDDYDDEDEDEDDEEEEDDDGYAWKIAGFTNCSRTCGGGMQSTMVICVKMGTTPVRVTDENCDVGGGGGGNQKPASTNITCNNRPCQPSWEASDWGPCSTSCDRGRQVRKVECRQRISSAAVVMVTAARCQHETRPEVARECNADRPCYAWKTTEWSECSAVCGKGRRTREVTCAASGGGSVDESNCAAGSGLNGRPTDVEECQMEACSKSWYHSRWPTQCSSDCGDGVHSRRVHCAADDNKCNEKTKPPTTKECRTEVPCGGKWFISSWTHCSVSCGDGVKRRDVVCVKKLDKFSVIVNDENCIESDRVEAEEPCSEGPCPPTWFTTDWSECSRTCNTGVQSREAKCLDDKERLSQSCDPLDKPELKQTCNTNPCVAKLNRNKAEQPVVTCRDQLKTCRIVVQARLCRYKVYKDSCCFSCTSRGYNEEETATTSEMTIK